MANVTLEGEKSAIVGGYRMASYIVARGGAVRLSAPNSMVSGLGDKLLSMPDINEV